MARKGENIYKRKDGRWEARYEKGRNSKGQIIYGSLYGKSYREVREKKINSIVKLPVAKTISPSESMNICDVSTRWLESIRHTVKESTYSCYLTLIQKHILTYFNNSSMITSEHIQQFINYKITNDLSPTSVRNIVVLLERILRYGEDENLLPVTKRSFTFPKSSFYINDTLDVSQLSILARYLYLEGDAFSVGLLLCMHTGIRIGDDDDKIRLNQRKPSKYKGLSRFGPEKNLQRINKFMKERPIFYKNLIQMKENIRFYLRCFYCITKVMILQFNSENRTELARNG